MMEADRVAIDVFPAGVQHAAVGQDGGRILGEGAGGQHPDTVAVRAAPVEHGRLGEEAADPAIAAAGTEHDVAIGQVRRLDIVERPVGKLPELAAVGVDLVQVVMAAAGLAVREQDFPAVVMDHRVANGAAGIVQQRHQLAGAHVQFQQPAAVGAVDPQIRIDARISEIGIVVAARIAARPALGEDDLLAAVELQAGQKLGAAVGLLLATVGFQPFECFGPRGIAGGDFLVAERAAPQGQLVDIAAKPGAGGRGARRIADAQPLVGRAVQRTVVAGRADQTAVQIHGQRAFRRPLGMGAGDRGQVVPATGVDPPPFGEQVLAVALVMVQARPALVNCHVVGVLRRGAPSQHQAAPRGQVYRMDPGFDGIFGTQPQSFRQRSGQPLGVAFLDAQRHGPPADARQFLGGNEPCGSRFAAHPAGDQFIHAARPGPQRSVETPRRHKAVRRRRWLDERRYNGNNPQQYRAQRLAVPYVA
jgi:hypothetical protein